MKILLTFLSLVFISITAHASGFQKSDGKTDSNKINKILKEIAAFNVFEASNTVGDTGKPSPQWDRYKKLAAIATPFDLLQIANTNSNAVVRLYAFKALAERMDNLPAEIAEKFKNDDTIVLYQTGDIVQKFSVKYIANGFLK